MILSARAKDALVSSVVNNDGVIEARSVSSRDGVIRLEGGDSGVVSVAGTLDASGSGAGETGGRITVTGDKVALLDGARLDASGSAGGGSVRVGGGYQGSDADVRNAERTFVSSSAEIHADALDTGNGGHVVVWADGDTRFHGAISATGGAAGGDGGFVEVSGKQQLGFDGSVDTSAQKRRHRHAAARSERPIYSCGTGRRRAPGQRPIRSSRTTASTTTTCSAAR